MEPKFAPDTQEGRFEKGHLRDFFEIGPYKGNLAGQQTPGSTRNVPVFAGKALNGEILG
jgi:hypothetical protein